MLSDGMEERQLCENRSQQVLGYAQEHVFVRCSLYESVLGEWHVFG
jgi:hypothetical protein